MTATLPTHPNDVRELLDRLRTLSAAATNDAEARAVARRISQITRRYRLEHGLGLPATPVAQALELDDTYRARPHLDYLAERITVAVRDVERGQNRLLAVSMPPRAGKSTLLSQHTPLWLLRRHPEWQIIMTSQDGALAGEWARSIRNTIEEHPTLGVSIAPDGGAGTRWATDNGGGVFATSTQGPIIGRGARVFLIDDPVKDFADAHSEVHRQRLWDWWLSTAQTRLEPPYLVIVVMSRWHEDDLIGRLMSAEYEGDPARWEYIRLGALAGEDDPLGRAVGEPLLSPLLDEDRDEALTRWDETRRTVGSYTWAALYQQTPAPAQGAIFDDTWWRYWTLDPNLADDDRVILLDREQLTTGRWLDSWDTSFKGTDSSDFVVGQRWVRTGPYRVLVAQRRGRWSFTQALEEMEEWAKTDDEFASPYGAHVHLRLVEESANGPAILDVMRNKVSGMKSVRPRDSKEARARAITPEVESGHVLLPHPQEASWVPDLLSELRNLHHDINDDQVDALSQALLEFRDAGRGTVTVPGRNPTHRLATMGAPRNIARAAMTDRRGRRGGAR